MITSLRVQNFKCLRDTSVQFAPLTVLIGPNDSGKTSIFDALNALADTTRVPTSQLASAWPLDAVTWNRDSQLQVTWAVEGSGVMGSLKYELGLPRSTTSLESLVIDGRQRVIRRDDTCVVDPATQHHVEAPWSAGYTGLYSAVLNGRPGYAAIQQDLFAEGPFRLDPAVLRRRAVPKPGAQLGMRGENLAAVLDALISGPDREAVIAMEAALQSALPNLKGFAVRSLASETAGEKGLEFVLAVESKRPITIPCELASDGAMLLTAFLALAYSDTPEVLLIEEPENGLHPARLKDVIDLLRKMTTGEVGNKPRQIILTTHSPLLLNYARPEEVRIVRRDAELGTQVTPMTDVKGIDGLLQEFGMGELWYLLGEQGLVEGKQP
jgi:predicted ATPase